MSTSALGRQFTVTHEGKHPYGGEYATASTPDGEHAGTLRYTPGTETPHGEPLQHNEVSYIHTVEEHRRQGVARSLYGAVAEKTGRPFLHVPDDMTPEAKKAVGRVAAEAPDQHLKFGWRNSQPVVTRYPRARR